MLLSAFSVPKNKDILIDFINAIAEKIAKKLLKLEGFSVESVAAITQLSLEQVQAIKEQLKDRP